jgi:23S rRNA pseudouridine1911/1915/1917 synthase
LATEIVQGDKTGDVPLLEKVRDYLKIKYNKQGAVFCGLIHRIDRPVSGIVIFAKTSKALARMNAMIQRHELHKFYQALVEKPLLLSEGTLSNYLKKNEKENKTYVYEKEVAGSKKAILNYKMIGQTKNYYLVEIELLTGRHHQIRSQLAAAGSVIKGDLKYGAKRPNSDGSISLHAFCVEFEHPVNHQFIRIEAVPPFPISQ